MCAIYVRITTYKNVFEIDYKFYNVVDISI